jgi:low affinity Fe/Cu permease
MNNKNLFEKLANASVQFTGSSIAFLLAFLIVVVWAATGPVFNYSQTWQLVINTGTTIVTFLMVFLIQKAQNKDSKAIQLKLNELIASNKYSSNQMIDIEELTEEELDKLKVFYRKLAILAAEEVDFNKAYSIDSAIELHQGKLSALSPSKIRKIRKKNLE